ncbi:sensor histidine kinase [Lactococcus laudensis]|uniref:sensor histidine kinase n=1 Tax=Pseudolactococcus laudensis TaxID=1494461 RepID=UPI002FC6998C
MSEIRNGHLEVSVTNPMKQTAMEVKQLTDDFEKMRGALIHSTEEQVKLEENRKTLVASISHDLKTPITSIIGYVEGLLDGVATIPEKRDKYLQTIRTKALSLNDLIEELFLYSKLDAAAIPFNFERINLNEFLKHIIEEFQIQATEISLQLSSQELKASYVMADRIQLNRVFINLIENSLKFKVKDRPLSVQLGISETADMVEVRVSDNGQGISAEQLPFVFNHFYRGEVSRPTDTGGSALGLAIVKQIIEMHEGSVMIESQIYQGTTVVVLLKKA